ncbi:MAG: MFS transporter [Candidatus Odinarchaeum yellowstonii]|uniref:MFS transporter n=1 Tax=Odinarchaeota yellowstonii (strain LCB_4) TaxID=1841599 RepID=A0AAF0ICV7_ODILC|nr:MAG: MFS transporter [Candidatus Odinarchaeum yellowstonii]
MVSVQGRNLIAGMLIRTLFGYSVFDFVLLSITLQNVFSITEIGVGALMAAYWIPAIALQFVVGRYADKIGFKKLVVAGTITVALGSLIISQAYFFELVLIGRFITGVGAILFWTPGVVIVSNVYPKEKLSFATSLIVLSYGVGTLTAFLTVPVQAIILGWRSIFFLAFVYGFIVAILVQILTTDTPANFHKPANTVKIFKSMELFKIAVAQCLSMAAWTVFLTFFTRTLIFEKSVNANVANLTVVFASIAGIISALLGGYFSDKKYRKGLWIAVPLTLLSLTFLILPFSVGFNPVSDLFLSWFIGALVWIPQGPIWALPKIVEPDYPNTAMTLLVCMTGVTVTVFPLLFGWLTDFTGSFFYSYIMIALIVLCAALVSYRIRN